MSFRSRTQACATLQYDSNSRITGITQNLVAQRSVSSTSGTATITTTQLYTQPISWTVGYDNRDRITSFTRIFSGVGQQSANSESFTYDPNSNRLSSISISATDTDKDGLYETSEQRKNTTRVLSIQPSSNKLQGFTQTLTTLTGTKTNSTVASQINYTLDANGNLTSDGLRDFQYDAENRLSKVILGTTFVGTDTITGNELAAHTYLHNAAGQRVFKSEPKTEATAPNEATLGTGFVSWLQTNFSWLWATAQTNATLGNSYLYADGQLPSWALLGEYGNGGASSTGRTEYIWLPTGNGQAIPVGMLRSGQLHAIHTDHLGTPRLMVDRTNTPVWQWAYSAFGDNAPTGILKPTTNAGSAFISTPAGSNGNTSVTLLATSAPVQANNLRFPGQFADSETGFFYNYFRSYIPSQARYGQNDPKGLAAGWNRFGYAGGDGLNGFDPYGLDVCLLTTRNSIGVGTHSAIYISGSKPVIYDPSGSYAYSKTGEEFAYGPLADIQKFKDFHKKKDGNSTDVSCRKTTPEEDKKILEKALEQDQGFGPVCSRRISDLLSGSPSFPGVSPGTWFPGNLARQFK